MAVPLYTLAEQSHESGKMLSLMITGFDDDPSRVTEILGMTPTTARRKDLPTPAGRANSSSFWLYKVDRPELRSGATHHEALNALLALISTRIECFVQLRRELNPTTMSITGGFYFDAHEQEAIWLDANQMKVLADAGIDWGINLYSAADEPT